MMREWSKKSGIWLFYSHSVSEKEHHKYSRHTTLFVGLTKCAHVRAKTFICALCRLRTLLLSLSHIHLHSVKLSFMLIPYILLDYSVFFFQNISSFILLWPIIIHNLPMVDLCATTRPKTQYLRMPIYFNHHFKQWSISVAMQCVHYYHFVCFFCSCSTSVRERTTKTNRWAKSVCWLN